MRRAQDEEGYYHIGKAALAEEVGGKTEGGLIVAERETGRS